MVILFLYLHQHMNLITIRYNNKGERPRIPNNKRMLIKALITIIISMIIVFLALVIVLFEAMAWAERH